MEWRTARISRAALHEDSTLAALPDGATGSKPRSSSAQGATKTRGRTTPVRSLSPRRRSHSCENTAASRWQRSQVYAQQISTGQEDKNDTPEMSEGEEMDKFAKVRSCVLRLLRGRELSDSGGAERQGAGADQEGETGFEEYGGAVLARDGRREASVSWVPGLRLLRELTLSLQLRHEPQMVPPARTFLLFLFVQRLTRCTVERNLDLRQLLPRPFPPPSLPSPLTPSQWLDFGSGLNLSLPQCPRPRLEKERITYLTAEQRRNYLVRINDRGLLVWARNGEEVDTTKWYRDGRAEVGVVRMSEQELREVERRKAERRRRARETGDSSSSSSSSDSDGQVVGYADKVRSLTFGRGRWEGADGFGVHREGRRGRGEGLSSSRRGSITTSLRER